MAEIEVRANTKDVPEHASPKDYENEAELHRLVESNPHLLPLDGSPKLTVLASEVTLGWGSLDVLAVESTGRPVVIEVKLARNQESYREIVAQVLFYAAFLRGLDVEYLERYKLGSSIVEAVQAGSNSHVDEEAFNSSLQDHLGRGSFRLVFALDAVHPELERVVAYLDSITSSEVAIDLVALPIYEVEDKRSVVPQRIVPCLNAADDIARPTGAVTPGARDFKVSVESLPATSRRKFYRLIEWAEKMAECRGIRLSTFAGASPTLVLFIDQTGLVMLTIPIVRQEPRIAVHRTAFEHHVPNSIDSVEKAIAPKRIGYGNYIGKVTSEVMDALTEALHKAGNC